MAEELTGIIAAAGLGTRLHPKSKRTSKVLLNVDGQSLLSRNISIMKNEIGIKKIYIITGSNHNDIEKALRFIDLSDVDVSCVKDKSPRKGLAKSLLMLEDKIDGHFCLMLSDELYDEAGHETLKDFLETDFSVVCAVRKWANTNEIKKNYSVELNDNRIVKLVEKPDTVENEYLGCGTFLFHRDFFHFIKSAKKASFIGKSEFIDAINLAIEKKGNVLPFFLSGDYVNVNTLDDLNYANYIIRRKRFDQKKVSLIIPAWNEEDSIGHVIADFNAVDDKYKVDEIIVADNLSTDSTVQIARDKGAIVHSTWLRGYGDAIRYGMDRAKGDILVVTEADGSFKARDLGKILEYLKDADMVIGTRTTKQMIEQGANMPLLLRLANQAVAKIIELLWWRWNEPRITDVGCTYRGIWKDAWEKIRSDLDDDGPAFSPEMIIEPIRKYMRIIEIPVSYHGRIGGESKHSGNTRKIIKTGFSMVLLIFMKKIKYMLLGLFKRG